MLFLWYDRVEFEEFEEFEDGFRSAAKAASKLPLQDRNAFWDACIPLRTFWLERRLIKLLEDGVADTIAPQPDKPPNTILFCVCDLGNLETSDKPKGSRVFDYNLWIRYMM